MRKKLQISCLLVLMFVAVVPVKAQWVPVQQAFANYISTYISAVAVSGNMLDTTNAEITGLRYLTINYYSGLTDIAGIRYFDNLEHLKVNISITSVPALPSSLKTFETSSSSLTSATAPLPGGLYALKLHNAKITALPALPAGLNILANHFQTTLELHSPLLL